MSIFCKEVIHEGHQFVAMKVTDEQEGHPMVMVWFDPQDERLDISAQRFKFENVDDRNKAFDMLTDDLIIDMGTRALADVKELLDSQDAQTIQAE
jgi:hypothetical protein